MSGMGSSAASTGSATARTRARAVKPFLITRFSPYIRDSGFRCTYEAPGPQFQAPKVSTCAVRFTDAHIGIRPSGGSGLECGLARTAPGHRPYPPGDVPQDGLYDAHDDTGPPAQEGRSQTEEDRPRVRLRADLRPPRDRDEDRGQERGADLGAGPGAGDARAAPVVFHRHG